MDLVWSSLQKRLNLETTHIILLYSSEENMDLRSVKVFYYNSKNRFVNQEPELLFEFVKRLIYTTISREDFSICSSWLDWWGEPLYGLANQIGGSEATSKYMWGSLHSSFLSWKIWYYARVASVLLLKIISTDIKSLYKRRN